MIELKYTPNLENWYGRVDVRFISLKNYAEKYNLKFAIVTKDVEDKIYGVWQVKDVAG